MKAAKISFSTTSSSLAVKALVAAFSPFGSLTQGVDGRSLSDRMVAYVQQALQQEQPMCAADILRLLWGSETSDCTTPHFKLFEVILETPTSGTLIRLRRAGVGLTVEVDFGPQGSETRALAIIAAAERAGVQFSVYIGPTDASVRVERSFVLLALREQAAKRVAWLQVPGYYTPEYQAAELADAREAVAFFAALT